MKDKKSADETLIYLFFSFNGQRLKYSTGETVKPSQWNFNTMRVKKSVGGSTAINDWLDKLQADVKVLYRSAKTNNEIVSVSILRDMMNTLQNGKSEKPNLFEFIESFISSVQNAKKPATLSVYRTTLKHLQAFASHSKSKIDFETIDLDFYNKFIDYLVTEKDFSTNNIGKYIKTLKVFLNEATERGLNTKLDYKSKKFKVSTEETESIYLNEDEIEKLMDHEFFDRPHLEKARDLFVVGCYTGLRFSDFTQIKAENFKNGYINIRTQKTDEFVSIPIHPIIQGIMTKYKRDYSNSLPPAISNQKMNEYLKVIGSAASINEEIITNHSKGKERVEERSKKFELITTHTARRSFATNLFLSGFPPLSIMKITGHKTEKSFLKYIKMKPHENALRLKKFWAEKK